jgi:hypothetical protein
MEAWLLLALLLALAMFPRSFARTRQAFFALVERLGPEMRPTRLAFWLVVLFAILCFAQVFAADLAWLAAIDVATYLEALAAVTFTAGALRIAAARKVVVARLRRSARAMRGIMRRAARAVRVRAMRQQAPPANDDGAPGLAWV